MRELLFLFESSDRVEYARYLLARDRVAQMTFRLTWLDPVLYGGMIDHIDAAIEENIDPRLASVRATGSAHITNQHTGRIIFDLGRSLAIAFVVISIWLVIILRSIRYGLLALLPNTFPIVLAIGVMVALGIPINIGVLLAGTVTLGLIVDDTIHYFHHVRGGMRAGLDLEEILVDTAKKAGLAMIMTTVTIALFFGVLMAGRLSLLRTIGLMASSVVLIGGLLELVLTPALIRAIAPTRRRKMIDRSESASRLTPSSDD